MGEEEQELEEELSEGGFMELLSSGDLLEGEEELSYFSCSSSSTSSSLLAATQMVHFGLNGVGAPPQNSSADSSVTNLSSSPSSTSTVTTTAAASSSKASRRVERGAGRAAAAATAPAAAAVTGMSKKPKREGSASTGTIKVRKEKLGDRIMALQQLVSPFGKSDTASVLHEALGYIRFLHDQVQVLSSPYLQHLPPSAPLQGGGEASRASDLRSRGLCLVPISCTEHVADGNGADFWSPSMGSSHLNAKH